MSDPKATKDKAIDEMRNTLLMAAKQFGFYAKNHLDKSPPDYAKTRTNADWADTCNKAVERFDNA